MFVILAIWDRMCVSVAISDRTTLSFFYEFGKGVDTFSVFGALF